MIIKGDRAGIYFVLGGWRKGSDRLKEEKEKKEFLEKKVKKTREIFLKKKETK